MSKVPVDVLVEIHYRPGPKEADESFVVFTNAKHEALEEILCNWVQDQIGRGGDDAPPPLNGTSTPSSSDSSSRTTRFAPSPTPGTRV